MTHDGHDVTSQPGLLTCWQHGGVKGLFQYRAGLVQEVLRPYCSWGSWRCGNDRCGRGDFEFSHEDKHSSSMLSLHMFLHHKEVDYELGWGDVKQCLVGNMQRCERWVWCDMQDSLGALLMATTSRLRQKAGQTQITPWWTPNEPACICGSWAKQGMRLDEASAPYLEDY